MMAKLPCKQQLISTLQSIAKRVVGKYIEGTLLWDIIWTGHRQHHRRDEHGLLAVDVALVRLVASSVRCIIWTA